MHGKKGNSIIEIVVVIVILTIGLTGAYSIVSRGQNLSRTTEDRIRAINIAREGIEAVQNIRDTNWLLFSSDYEHCWMTNNYNSSCIGGNTVYTNGDYILLRNPENRWYLISSTSSGVYLDTNGLTFQSGSAAMIPRCNSTTIPTNCLTPFTRLISLSYPGSSTGSVDVTSTVKWFDSNSSSPHVINLKTTLTNWKWNK